MTQPEVDNHKLMFHPERVVEWRERGDCFPIYVEVGPTNACNHRCIFCALDFLEYGKDFIDRDIMILALKEMANLGVKSVMFAGEGEPLLHKHIEDFIKEAKKSGLDVSLTTNGILFGKKKAESCLPHLSWIRFSVDSGSLENYSLVHGTNSEDFGKVIENIKESVKIKKEKKLDIIIGVQFLMIPQNMREAVKLAEILKNIGADNLQIKPYSHHPNSLNDLYVNPEEYNKIEEDLRRFNTDKFKVLFRKATINRIEEGVNYPECYGLPFFALIDAKGNIIPCNLFYGKQELNYGSLYENSFSEIWKGEKRKEVIKKLKGGGVEKCRRGCRLDVINRYLERLKNPQLHDNFI